MTRSCSGFWRKCGSEDKAPSSKLQAPEKLQTPSTNQKACARGRRWSLELGVYLELGAWILELLSRSCPKRHRRPSHRPHRCPASPVAIACLTDLRNLARRAIARKPHSSRTKNTTAESAIRLSNPKAVQPTQSCRSKATDTKRANHKPSASDAKAAIAEKNNAPQRMPRCTSPAVKERPEPA